MKTRIDHISGATTHGPDYLWRASQRPLPARVTRFLAANHIAIPAPGQFIPIHEIDRALAGESISDRVAAKAELRAFRLIEA
jgi:hypothetical protein